MNKKQFLEKFEDVLKSRKGTLQAEGKVGPIEDRNKCDFTGVYALFNNGELVYVGSGYTPETHTVKDRLSQYITKSSTGNNLWPKVVGCGLAKDEDSAIEVIKGFEFIAFEHNDLENLLIQETQLDWNKHGNKK